MTNRCRPESNSNCPASARTPVWFTPAIVIAAGKPELVAQFVAFTLLARKNGRPEVAEYAEIHITVADSNKIELNVQPVGDAITVRALFTPGVLFPTRKLPPERGEKNPLVSEFRFVMDAMPGVLEEVDTKSPPSGEMARPRLDPDTAKDVTPPDCPSLLTCTPDMVDIQNIDPLTLTAARVSFPMVNEVVVSSTPSAFSTAIVQTDVVEEAPPPARTL